jgi:hypothetical protein
MLWRSWRPQRAIQGLRPVPDKPTAQIRDYLDIWVCLSIEGLRTRRFQMDGAKSSDSCNCHGVGVGVVCLTDSMSILHIEYCGIIVQPVGQDSDTE